MIRELDSCSMYKEVKVVVENRNRDSVVNRLTDKINKLDKERYEAINENEILQTDTFTLRQELRKSNRGKGRITLLGLIIIVFETLIIIF